MNYFISIKTVINKNINKAIPVSIGLVSEEGEELYLIIEDNVNTNIVSIKDKETILDNLEPKGSINRFIFNDKEFEYQTWQSYQNVSQNLRGFLSNYNKNNYLWGFDTIFSNPAYIELMGGLNKDIVDYPPFIYDIKQLIKINELIGIEPDPTQDNSLVSKLNNINNNYNNIIPQLTSNEYNALGEATLIKMIFMNEDNSCNTESSLIDSSSSYDE